MLVFINSAAISGSAKVATVLFFHSIFTSIFVTAVHLGRMRYPKFFGYLILPPPAFLSSEIK